MKNPATFSAKPDRIEKCKNPAGFLPDPDFQSTPNQDFNIKGTMAIISKAVCVIIGYDRKN